jgi:hypothetical protein
MRFILAAVVFLKLPLLGFRAKCRVLPYDENSCLFENLYLCAAFIVLFRNDCAMSGGMCPRV